MSKVAPPRAHPKVAEGRRQALARAHAHARKTLVEGLMQMQALEALSKIKWRTKQPERGETDYVSPGCRSTSQIKWRTVSPEQAKSCDDPDSKQRLKQTKDLTVGISRDRMCTSPTSQRVRPVGWVSSKLDQEEELGLLEDEEELADPLDGEGLEAGERPQGSSSIFNRSSSRTCMSEGQGLTAPEVLHTRAVRNLEALAREIEPYEMVRSC
jgi:hypothetical protein